MLYEEYDERQVSLVQKIKTDTSELGLNIAVLQTGIAACALKFPTTLPTVLKIQLPQFIVLCAVVIISLIWIVAAHLDIYRTDIIHSSYYCLSERVDEDSGDIGRARRILFLGYLQQAAVLLVAAFFAVVGNLHSKNPHLLSMLVTQMQFITLILNSCNPFEFLALLGSILIVCMRSEVIKVPQEYLILLCCAVLFIRLLQPCYYLLRELTDKELLQNRGYLEEERKIESYIVYL